MSRPKLKMASKRRRKLLTGKRAWELAFTNGKNSMVFPPNVKRTPAAIRRYKEGRDNRTPGPIKPPPERVTNPRVPPLPSCPQCGSEMRMSANRTSFICTANPLHPKRFVTAEAAYEAGLRHSYYPAFTYGEKPAELAVPQAFSALFGVDHSTSQYSPQRIAYSSGLIGQEMPDNAREAKDGKFFYELGKKHEEIEKYKKQLEGRWEKLVELCRILVDWNVESVVVGRLGIELDLKHFTGEKRKTLLFSAQSAGIIDTSEDED